MDQSGQHSGNHERMGAAVMAELFEAIGFEVLDEDAYNLLAEYAETSGERSQIHRGDATLHGRCWRLGEGLEVWSIVYDGAAQLYYADCRPAFRSRYVRTVYPWELIEYDEDGEAIVRGRIRDGAEVIFELQNLTELNQAAFRETQLQVAVAGLAYSAEVRALSAARRSAAAAPPHFQLADPASKLSRDTCENDYVIRGTILAWREMQNSITGGDVVWIYIDAEVIRLEVLVSRQALRGELAIGAGVTARVWLQGHVLDGREIRSRYEGVDRDTEPGDFWSRLRRSN
jgi:Domain of unknown function, E. rectale Gene description (DUF3881)